VFKINELVDVVFSGLSGLIIDDVMDEGELIRVRARSRGVPVPCPGCAVETAHVHAWCERTVADVPLDGRRVVVNVRVRRLACRDWQCPRRTFREQICGVLERYQRRTVRLAAQVGAVVRELAGRASARVFLALGVQVSRHSALRALLGIPLYPAIIRLWERAWAEFTPFLAFDPEIRRIICSINAIESVNARIRRAVKARGHFPNEQAALKCVYIAVMSLDPTGTGRKRWTMRWKPALKRLRPRIRRPPGRRTQVTPHNPSYTERWTRPRRARPGIRPR
jgi:hypothetical protein